MQRFFHIILVNAVKSPSTGKQILVVSSWIIFLF